MLDSRLVRPILEGIDKMGMEATVAILPDHPTPVETGVHARDPVPVAVMRPGEAPDNTERYDEDQAKLGNLPMMRGDDFIKLALGVS
jgi:2,3-bisphosphoglycerate-independent phosphoglycerate mutase